MGEEGGAGVGEDVGQDRQISSSDILVFNKII